MLEQKLHPINKELLQQTASEKVVFALFRLLEETFDYKSQAKAPQIGWCLCGNADFYDLESLDLERNYSKFQKNGRWRRN